MIALRAMTPSWPVGSHTQTDQFLVVGGAPAAKHVEVGQQGPLLRCSPKLNPPRQAAPSTNHVCCPFDHSHRGQDDARRVSSTCALFGETYSCRYIDYIGRTGGAPARCMRSRHVSPRRVSTGAHL